MRRLKFIALVLILCMAFSTAGAFACTGMYVGKDVSAEGTTLIARSEDQGTGMYNKLFFVQERVTKAGRYMVDTGEDQNGFKVKLPKTTYKYTYLADAVDGYDGMYYASCANEYGLAVVGTVTTGVSEEYEKIDPAKETGTGLREAILPGLIACQAKTAREAVEVAAKYHDEYGSEEWNTTLFSDKNEAWIFENYGGHSYAAMKLPSDKVAVFGNQIMIDWVDPADTENFYLSANLVENLEKLAKPVKDDKGRYNLVLSLAPGGREEYSNMRTWRGHQVFAPSQTGAYSDNEYYSLLFTPDKKVSVTDVMQLFGDRYEGTEFDMMKPENAGRRPIGVTRQSDVHIFQTFTELPADTCQLQWLAMGNAEHAIFVPAFSGITDTYSKYKIDNTETYEAVNDGFYYVSKNLCQLAESDRQFLSQGVKDYNLLQEKIMLKDVQNQISKIKKAYAVSKKNGRKYVTDLAKKVAKEQYTNAKILGTSLAFRQGNNINDRVNNARKKTFEAEVKLIPAASYLGYTVKSKTVSKGVKSYTLTSAAKTVKFTVGEEEYTVTENGTTTKAEMRLAPYIRGGKLYVPMSFVEVL